MEQSSEPTEVDLAGLSPFVRRRLKIKMIDLVLAWARLDAAIAQLASAQFSMQPTVGAIIFGKMGVTDRLIGCES
jgi:hypothetical protein